jgi:ubiquinone/menaquinone biosynthesis C-methylase UbiE
MLAVHQRRAREVAPDLYSPWQPGEDFMRSERRRVAAQMLYRNGVFPAPGTLCLEVGCGSLGWFPELIGWGLRASDLHGIEMDPVRAREIRERLPVADLRTGDATNLPWPEESFGLAISSTVFTSIIDRSRREAVAEEITRVLKPGGALLWYDFAIHPRSNDVRAIGRRELATLFPKLSGEVRRITLAPPLARLVAPRSWLAATLLGSIPLLRTHLIAVLIKTA